MSITFSPMTALTQLRFETSWPAPSTARVAVVGEVDLATAHLLRDRLLDIQRERTPAVLDVNVAGVTFLDCTGISALVAARNAAVRAGGQLRISDPQPIVRRMLEVTGLLGVLTAPVIQPRPLPTRSDHPSRATTAATTEPPAALAV